MNNFQWILLAVACVSLVVNAVTAYLIWDVWLRPEFRIIQSPSIPDAVVVTPGAHVEQLATTVIVMAAQGTGKTRHADGIARRFGCTSIVDDWDGATPVPNGALVLTNMMPPELAQARP